MNYLSQTYEDGDTSGNSVTIFSFARAYVFARALQSDRFTVEVGPGKDVFKVPQDLLIQCSAPFEKMCVSSFKENTQRIIELPDDEPLTFERFFLWLHSLSSHSTLDYSDDDLLYLGIFAEKYHIRVLMNQISNIIRKAIVEKRWKISPDRTRIVYSSVSAKSNLTRLFSNGLMDHLSTHGPFLDCNIWEQTFQDFADLGWDYFRRMQKRQTKTSQVKAGGACRFHDHSDVSDWVPKEVYQCPFPEGAPVELSKEKHLPTRTCNTDSGKEEV